MSFPCETGCGRTAVVRLGKSGRWAVCADCAELARFRRFRVAHLVRSDLQPEDQPVLRRDSRGWWAEDRSTSSILGPPRPLAEVLAEYAP